MTALTVINMTRARALAAFIATVLVCSVTTPAAASDTVVSEWDTKVTTKFFYEPKSSELFADAALLQKHANSIKTYYHAKGRVEIALWFFGFTDRRCSPAADWVKKLKLRNPCKVDDYGISPANRELSFERAEALQQAVFSKLTRADREKMLPFAVNFGEGERFAEVDIDTCRDDESSCTKDRYADAMFLQRKQRAIQIPEPEVSTTPDLVRVLQGTTAVNVPVLENDVCRNTECVVALTAESSSPYVVPTAVRADGSFDVWVHPLTEGGATFQYSLLYLDSKTRTQQTSSPTTVTVAIQLPDPPPPISAEPGLAAPEMRWARLNTTESITAALAISCAAATAVSSTRCERWAGSRATAATVVRVIDASSSLTAPAGYPSNSYKVVQGADGSTTTTYRFARATAAGSYFTHRTSATVLVRYTEERMNPDGSITVLSSREQPFSTSAATRIGVVGATR